MKSFTHGERVVWILIAFSLFITEMRAVYKDRELHDKQQADARSEQLREFNGIATRMDDNLDRSDRNFKATMAKSKIGAIRMNKVLIESKKRLEQAQNAWFDAINQADKAAATAKKARSDYDAARSAYIIGLEVTLERGEKESEK